MKAKYMLPSQESEGNACPLLGDSRQRNCKVSEKHKRCQKLRDQT